MSLTVEQLRKILGVMPESAHVGVEEEDGRKFHIARVTIVHDTEGQEGPVCVIASGGDEM